jgi:uncharacterized glyoxalase superfamily protein PhnB
MTEEQAGSPGRAEESGQAGRREDGRAVSSSVEVGVDPDTAFTVFSAELDLWWVRGPINHHAAGRARAMRCEPWVGGRLLEVYDDEAGDALELARITVWEQGKVMAWHSSLDDVDTEVRFEPSGAGTLVQVTARIRGQDRGGSSWVRVVPSWYGSWCARRDHERPVVRDLSRLALAISYTRPAAATRWLADVFGFESPGPLPEGTDPLSEDARGHPWIEFRLGDGSLMIFKRETGDDPSSTHVPWVYVDDVEAHFARSTAAGATIVEPLANPWGLPMYTAEDPEGHRWTFAQARPTQQ